MKRYQTTLQYWEDYDPDTLLTIYAFNSQEAWCFAKAQYRAQGYTEEQIRTQALWEAPYQH